MGVSGAEGMPLAGGAILGGGAYLEEVGHSLEVCLGILSMLPPYLPCCFLDTMK